MRRHAAGLVAGLLIALAAAAPASADHNRTTVPSGLTATLSSAHFVIHYNSGTASLAYAQAARDDFEESYSRLVTGGGGTPNAGLEAPTADADGKTDVYLAAPNTNPSFTGGTVHGDPGHNGPAYVFMTPNLTRSEFRFRAAHEFMHVIQEHYTPGIGGFLTESTANWAAEFALPDVDPLDNNFANPGRPLDCTYGDWEGEPCGNGYRQWLFIQHLSEAYGADVVHGLLDQMRTNCSFGCTVAQERVMLNTEIDDQDPAITNLRVRYARYARDVLDPTDWTSTAPASIHAAFGRPANTVVAQDEDVANATATVDHLGTRYLRIRNEGGFQATGPNDHLEITLTRPAAISTQTTILKRAPGSQSLEIEDTLGGVSGTIGGLAASPAAVAEWWIPLTNDTETTDDLSFGYSITFERGTPSPPANDLRPNAQTLTLGTQAEVNNAFAGGNGTSEAPSCGPAANASRGTWYRFTAPNDGTYTFSSTGSDFPAVVAAYEGSAFQGCGAQSAGGSIGVTVDQGDVIDVYLGRRSSAPATSGITARLLASGPGAPPAPPGNDLRANPLVVSLGMEAQTDIAGATGTGAQEFPDCPGLANTRRGVWFRFTTPNSGTYTYDANSSNFPAVIGLYDSSTGAFGGCSSFDGSISIQQPAGRTYDVYVARRSGLNTQARFVVTGPAAPTPPADGGNRDTGDTGSTGGTGGTGGTTTIQQPIFTQTPVTPTETEDPTTSRACTSARARVRSAQKAVTNATKARKRARSKAAKKKAAKKLRAAKKKLAAAKRAELAACGA